MFKKIFIVFLLTMVFAIVAQFAATQLLADPGSRILQLGSVFVFEDIEGIKHTAYYRLDSSGTKILELKVNGKDVPEEKRKPLKDFRYCLPDPKGTTIIEDNPYSCHKTVDVTNEAAFVGNSGSCPWLINPPGIWIDPCKLLSQ